MGPILAFVGLAAVGVALALAVVLGPQFALIPLGVLASLLIAAIPRARFAVVIFGALLTLQSSQALDLLKMAYLGAMFLALGAALLSLHEHANAEVSAFLQASFLSFLLVFISLFVALANGTPVLSWLRDAAPYLLLAAIPVLAADASQTVPTRTLVSVFVTAGTLSAASFGLVWAGASKRHLTDLPLDHLVYPSFLFAGAVFAFAIWKGLSGGKASLRWLLLASLIFAVVLTTGTRTALLLLVIPLVFLANKRFAADRPRRFVVLVGAVAVVAIAAFWIAQVTSENNAALLGRFGSFGQLASDPTSDQSVQDRLGQIGSAMNAFVSAPIFGVGLGHEFSWADPQGVPRTVFTIDTSISFFAKFGLLGLAFLILVAERLRTATRVPRARQPEVWCVISGYFSLIVCYLFFGSPFEEKGFSLALLCLMALLIAKVPVDTRSATATSSPERRRLLISRQAEAGSGRD